MHTKMLELAEKLEHRSCCFTDKPDVSEMYHLLAHDIRATFTPRDWREGCVVEQKKDGNWDVESPCRSYYLGRCLSWGMYDNRGCRFRTVGSHTSESSARAALASCTTPYPGHKESTCDSTGSSAASGVPSSAATTTTTNASPAATTSPSVAAHAASGSAPDTLTFGGPALRVAFHFDGDKLARWEILEQRNELRGIGLRGSIRSGNFPALYHDNVLHIRGKQYEKDNEYPIYGTHTRASITTLGAEIDQVNREWCEKLGIGEKAHIDYPQKLEQAEAWEAVCRVADEVDENWHKLSMIGRDSICTLIRNLSRDRDNLRRQLDAAEKVMEAMPFALSDVITTYRATYPKNGGAK